MNNLTIRAKDIRSMLKTVEHREPCFICGEHEAISEKHHLITLKECAFWINRVPNLEMKSPTVWLCPNHHRYWHLATKTLELPDCFTDKHVEKYKMLLSRRVAGLEELRKQINQTG